MVREIEPTLEDTGDGAKDRPQTPEPFTGIHPAAELFPKMNEKQFGTLKEGIKRNGQLEPVWIYEGQLIDGRHRLRACRALGIQARFEGLAESEVQRFGGAIGWVAAKNAHRRHLTPSQLGMIGARLLDVFKGEAKARQKRSRERIPVTLPEQPTKGEARDQAGKVVGVSGKTISEAAKVLKSGDRRLIDLVMAGKMSVFEANRKLAVRAARARARNDAKPAGEERGRQRKEGVRATRKGFVSGDVLSDWREQIDEMYLEMVKVFESSTAKSELHAEDQQAVLSGLNAARSAIDRCRQHIREGGGEQRSRRGSVENEKGGCGFGKSAHPAGA